MLLSLAVRRLAALLVLFAFAPLVAAQSTLTWGGSTDGDWNNPFNWSGGGIPGPLDLAIIPPGTPNTAQAVFGDVVVGSIQIQSGAVIGIQDGRTITVNENLTCNGAIDAFGSAQLRVENDLIVNSASASINGLAELELHGAGVISANPAVLLPSLRVTGDVRELTAGRAAGLFASQVLGLPAVELRLTNGASFTIDGDAYLNAPVTSSNAGASLRLLTINGTTTWDVFSYPAGAQSNAALVVRANGDWESRFQVPLEAGWVELGGAGTHVIRTYFGSNDNAIFRNLRIAEGTRVLENKSVIVLGELEVRSATFDLDWPESLEVRGDLDTNWAGANLIHQDLGATVPIRLAGDGTVTGGVNPLPDLDVFAGTRIFSNATAESVTLSGGFATTRLLNGTTLRTLGNFEHLNGALEFDTAGGSQRKLQVDGDFRQFGGTVASPSSADLIEVSGDWVSQAGYALANGWVQFVGSGDLSGNSPEIKRLRLVSGVRNVLNDVEVSGELLSTGGTTTGAGWVEMTGSITPVNTGANQVARLRVAANQVNFTTSRVGLLEVVGGIFRLLNGVTVTVDGDARFLGGQFASSSSGGSLRVLDVAGDFTEESSTAAGEQNFATVIRVAGDWVGDGGLVLPSGWVELDGAAPTTVGGASPQFGNLRILNGARTLTAAVEVEQELEVRATLDVSTFDLEVAQTLDSNWSGAAILGDGPIRLTGDGSLSTNGNSTPPLWVQSGQRSATTSFVDEVRISGGTWVMLNGTLCTVAGDALFEGGTIQSEAFGGSIRGFDINGSLTQSGTAISSGVSATVLRVAGDWSSDSAFALDEGWVELDGGDSEIGGPSPAFKRLRLVSGVNTLTSEVEVTGELVATSGSTAGTPWLNVTGSLTPVATGINEIARLRVDGPVDFTTSRVGDLELASGQLRLLNGVALTAVGDVDFVGGVFASSNSGATLRVLDVAGDFTESGTGPAVEQNSATVIRVAGDWVGSGDFVLPAGRVELDGIGATTIGGSNPVFGNLTLLNGQRTLVSDAVVEQELEVRSALDVADRDLEVVGTLDSNWAGASIAGVGPIRLTGDGELRTLASAITPVRIESGERSLFQASVEAFELAGGTVVMRNGTTCSVAGTATFSGGTLRSDPFGASLRGFDIAGALHHTGTVVDVTNTGTRISVAGDWTSDAGFVLDEGWVYLDGGAAVVDGPAPTFKRLRLDAGVKELAAPVEVFGELFASSGSTTGSEFLILTDALTPVSTGVNLIANLRVAAGTVSITTSRVGNLQLVGGALRHLNGATITVEGDCEFSGGVFESDPFGGSQRLVDVAGDFTALGAAITLDSSAQRFRVAGDWASNSTFSPTLATVELDGAGTTFLRGSVPGLDPAFANLEIRNGTRIVDGAIELSANLVTVVAGGRLEAAAGGDLVASAVPFTVNGTLAASAGGRLSLDAASSITVNGGGRLELIGAPGDPAILGGAGGGGYSCVVHGTLAARDFVVSQPGPDGLVMNGSYAAAPEDLRGGEFNSPASVPDSTLLTLGHAAAKSLLFVRFDEAGQVGTYNVRRTTGGDVDFVNFGGDFSGEIFEDDPGDRINWLPPMETELVFFTATNGAEQVRLDFETSFESAVEAFVLEVGATAGGPFATVAELSPAGVGSYSTVDAGAPADVERFYRLLERRTDGFVRLLATDSATPYSAATPANVRTVGAGGEFATIQAAIDAASTPFTVIRVEPGTYAPFTIDAPTALSLTIVPAGPGVVIDAAAAPVAILNVGLGRDVILADLTIDGGGAAAAVSLANNLGAVILDRCDVNGGAGQAGLEAALCLAVSIQDCQLSGSPGLSGVASGLYAGRGAIDALDASGASTVRLCGVAPGASTGDGTATVTSYGGVSPQLTAPRFQSLGMPFSVDLDAAPGAFFQLAASATALPLDLNDPDFWQMLLLVDASSYFELGEGFTDGAGAAAVALQLPPEGGLLGARLLVQGWTIQAVPTVEVRFSGAQPLIAMP